MNLAEAIGYIRQALQDGFVSLGIETLVRWPNQDFKQPKGTEWYQVDIVSESRETVDIGTPVGSRTAGEVVVSIFTPGGTSTIAHNSMAWDIMKILDNRDINDVRMRESQVITVGQFESFWTSRITTEFMMEDQA